MRVSLEWPTLAPEARTTHQSHTISPSDARIEYREHLGWKNLMTMMISSGWTIAFVAGVHFVIPLGALPRHQSTILYVIPTTTHILVTNVMLQNPNFVLGHLPFVDTERNAPCHARIASNQDAH